MDKENPDNRYKTVKVYSQQQKDYHKEAVAYYRRCGLNMGEDFFEVEAKQKPEEESLQLRNITPEEEWLMFDMMRFMFEYFPKQMSNDELKECMKIQGELQRRLRDLNRENPEDKNTNFGT